MDSTAAPPNCDRTALCVACTGPGEVLTGNSASNFNCLTTTTATPTTPTDPTPSCSPGAQFQKCTTSGNTCDFYTCLESEYHCEGTKYAYPLDYGLKYCTKFTQNLNKFSPAGKKWVHDVRLCLQNALLPDTDCKSNCQKIQDDAFKSHPNCYVDSGVCSLRLGDWISIVETVGLNGLKAGGTQVADTFGMCLAQWERLGESELRQTALAIVGLFAQTGKDVTNAILGVSVGQLRARLLKLMLSVGVPVAGL
ncbi:MAG: hypothetical protein M1839_004358 [Geoglossum umbratile]|nr:MAG: hypothetical protein M1839_004358 [Geoglossum umbratile]